MTTITGTGRVAPEDKAALTSWFADLDDHNLREVARAREASRISGMEVVYDLSMFDLEWSPVYWHQQEEPVAWVNKAGERRAGPHYPKDPAP